MINKMSLLNQVLGTSSKTTGGEFLFFCPFCGHHKRKFQINVEKELCHCWVCNSKFRSFYTLFKALNLPPSQLKLVERESYKPENDTYEESEKVLELPTEYKLLHNQKSSWNYNVAKSYLKKRGITDQDILKYQIGYCDTGTYAGRIIIPSFDSNWNLNYFVARSYLDSVLKYKNPPASKNTVIFESMIDWSEPITLVEGIFDAIAIKRNAIPLLGKTIPQSLRESILLNGVKDIIIALDSDAKTDSTKLMEQYLFEDVRVFTKNLKGKDPSEMGYIGYNNCELEEVGFLDLIQRKLST